MKIGNSIKELRKEKGIKQLDLAKESGLSQTFLSQLEKGVKTPSLETLEKISKVLDIPVPVLTFLAIEEDMVSEDKKEMYKKMMPTLTGIVKEVFM
ncbi:helix-turn-helix domain-containing protein [Carboxylicivirga marina]|uniref:helix-turn-helix domain-containing protein n=1 Tax=Carboxylicivirga marina TaxID=2800988 RepID=UPI0025970323|nr:helix-turn-helix transcriptional regulator [uncultured Carboxylicivirga sp.]